MYTLEAILARYPTIDGALEAFPSARLIRLPQGIGMIPMIGALLQSLEIRYQGGSKVTKPEWQQFSQSVHPDFERLLVGVEAFARELSRRGPVAYIEATFIGGNGGHETMMWENGERAGDAGKSINDILRRLGVLSESGHDEFATLGLGRHRSTKQWLSDAAT